MSEEDSAASLNVKPDAERLEAEILVVVVGKMSRVHRLLKWITGLATLVTRHPSNTAGRYRSWVDHRLSAAESARVTSVRISTLSILPWVSIRKASAIIETFAFGLGG